jgi:hypothetical protein
VLIANYICLEMPLDTTFAEGFWQLTQWFMPLMGLFCLAFYPQMRCLNGYLGAMMKEVNL